jgi:hypothetical protein
VIEAVRGEAREATSSAALLGRGGRLIANLFVAVIQASNRLMKYLLLSMHFPGLLFHFIGSDIFHTEALFMFSPGKICRLSRGQPTIPQT